MKPISTTVAPRTPVSITPADEQQWLSLQQVRTLQMDTPAGPGKHAHVNAASGLVKVGERLLVVGDDDLKLAVFSGPSKGTWVPLLPGTLPADGPTRRKVKPDLEALVTLPPFAGAPNGAVFAVTSGSTSTRTKGAFVPINADGTPGQAKPVDLSAVVTHLRGRIPNLNIEGAVVVGDSLRLLQRGGSGDRQNALIDLDLRGLLDAFGKGAAPTPDLVRKISNIDLGTLSGVGLGLSDASPLPDGRIVFTASAEDTTDPTVDGMVTGSVIGVMEKDGTVSAQFPVKGVKLEGVHAEVKGDDLHLTLVNDADDEKVASNLMTAVLPGLAKAGRAATTALVSTFDAGAKAAKPEAGLANAFAEVAKTAATRGTGWTTEVRSDAVAQIRTELSEITHFAKLADAGGLRPDRIAVAPFAPGARESEFLATPGADGSTDIVWLLRTQNGKAPGGLEKLAAELGITQVESAPAEGIAGTTPIAPPTDVSPKANFERAMRLADQLFSAAGGDPKAPDFQLFRYTVARYMLNATTPQSLAFLADTYKGDTAGLLATGQVPERWVEKLERGFKQPYTNDASLEWLRQMASKLTDAVKFVEEANVDHSPITFYTAGSTTKARWSVGSDLDVLIDTPDKALEKKILEGPFGFYGTADKEEFAILNASFYWDRTKFFGTPVEMAKGTEAMKPEAVERVFKQTSRDDWGIELKSTPQGTRVVFHPEAAEKFVREAPVLTETLYDYSRPTRAQLDTKWVTEHWQAVVDDAPELRMLSRKRLVDEGQKLVEALLPQALSPENVARYFATDSGKAVLKSQGISELPKGADLAALVPPMQMDEFLGLTSSAERLMVDFAASDKVKAAAEGGQGLQAAWRAEFGAAVKT